MSPCGRTFTQSVARELKAQYDHLILVCGHYEGIDQRFIDECVDEELSMGDFVLTGGEIPAMAVADAVCRMVPGVLPDAECFERNPTGPVCWNTPSIPGPPYGMTGPYRRFCSPATTPRWRRGGKRRAISAPWPAAPTCSPNLTRQRSPQRRSGKFYSRQRRNLRLRLSAGRSLTPRNKHLHRERSP